jgi:hypothetical protein
MIGGGGGGVDLLQVVRMGYEMSVISGWIF